MKRIAVLLFLSLGLSAQDKPVTISGYVFGDYYSVVSHHDPQVDGKNGFLLRRGYLTFDRAIAEALSARLRFEINQAGDFRSSTTMEPYVKDAYLRWTHSPKLDVYAGLSPAPTWENVEKIWGYRAVERTPLDLHRMGAARDLGIAVTGSFDAAKRYRYHVQAGNGASTGTETNEEKKVAASFAFVPANELFFEVYADRDSRPGDDDRTTLQAFGAYQRPGFRAGVQLARQMREPHDLDLASVFAVLDVRKNVSLLARVDRMFDPDPEGDRIAFLPFSTTSASTLLILGADWKAHKNVSIIPNVEVVQYDDDTDTTLLPRLTLYFTF